MTNPAVIVISICAGVWTVFGVIGIALLIHGSKHAPIHNDWEERSGLYHREDIK